MSDRLTWDQYFMTITQQVARNVFLPKMFPGMTLKDAREKSLRRKLLEAWVSLIITTRASKDAILEMYLNDMGLGQRGSFGIVGVPEAARLFFGKDVSNVTLAEAATIAGVFQSPSALSPFNNPARCKDRRNVVLQAMVDAGYITEAAADRAVHEPLIIVQRALESEAPYFVDYVGQTLTDQYPGLTTTTTQAVDVYTTLDLHLQRLAQEIGGMQRCHRADFTRAGVKGEPAPARLEDAFLAVEQCLGRRIAEADQYVGVGELDLAQHERQADRGFLRRRRAIAGRTPRHDVGDVGRGSVEPDRRHHPVEQLARAADERQALDVLIAPRRFAHEHDARLRIAVGENELGRGRAQRAAFEAFEQRAQLLEAPRTFRSLARRHHGGLG